MVKKKKRGKKISKKVVKKPKIIKKKTKKPIQKAKKRPKKEEPRQKQYHTPIDDFYNLIKEKKEMQLSKAAKLSKIKKELAEFWAKVLSEKGLIELNYTLLGEPVLKCKE